MKKKVSIIMIFVISLNMFLNLIAATSLPVGFDETLSVGQLIKSTDTVWFGTQAYPIYKLYGEPFISFDAALSIFIRCGLQEVSRTVCQRHCFAARQF